MTLTLVERRTRVLDARRGRIHAGDGDVDLVVGAEGLVSYYKNKKQGATFTNQRIWGPDVRQYETAWAHKRRASRGDA